MTAIHAPRMAATLEHRSTAVAVIALLAASLACVAIAPLLMPDSYSPIEHAISESAAQGVEGAWLARLGFLMLGFAVLLLAGLAGHRWGVWGRVFHRLYGLSIIAAAAFSHSPWEDVPFDEFEDLLHSVAAFAVGLTFTLGVLIVTFQRRPGEHVARTFDWVAIVAAPALPMLMFNITGIAGVVQRVLFGIGYLWYAVEAVRSARGDVALDYGRPSPQKADAGAAGGT